MPNNTNTAQGNYRESAPPYDHAERAGFCQECGRAVTSATMRRVGASTFCDHCASTQAGDQARWRSVYAGVPGSRESQTRARRSQTGPRPRLAACLGFMPGVGAMYNGQYGKGAMHLAVFVALLAMADHVSDVLYWLVWGWVFYQAFDAYHTAVARREGGPLPDPFGFNDVGSSFFGSTSGRSGTTAQTTQAAYVPGPPPYEQRPVDPAWNGENPYDVPYSPQGFGPGAPAPVDSSITSAPLQQPMRMPLTAMPTPLEGTRRFPVAALWLVGLGLVFLFGNMLPSWHVNGEWIAILALALLTIWSATHRWARSHARRPAGLNGRALLHISSVPAVLFLSCLLLILDAVHVASIARTWPVILVFWGALLFIQRVLPPPAIPSSPLDTPSLGVFDHEEQPLE